MKKAGIILFFLVFILSPGFSQGELDEQQRLFYRNEQTYGGTLSSTGMGGGFRYSKRINFFNKKVFEADFNIIKHPKEVKTSNPYFQNSKRFVFGKLNTFFNVRGGYGFMRVKYKKTDKGGIEVRLLYTGGVSLGFYKPVYYEVLTPLTLYEYTLVTEKFNPALHATTDIYGRASFFKGFNEIKFMPGIYGRIGVNFEFGKKDPVLNIIEGGITIDAYPKAIPIMATEDNKQIFIAFYVSYRFGKIIDKKSTKKLKYQEQQLSNPFHP